MTIYTKHAPAAGASMALVIRLNSDTGTNYGYAGLYGSTSSSGTAGVNSNGTRILTEPVQGWSTETTFGSNVITFCNYSNTSRYKNVLIDTKMNNSDSGGFIHGINQLVGAWASTSAITEIMLRNGDSNANFNAGSEFTLLGILRA